MYHVQVYSETDGWQSVTPVWESEVGLCYHPAAACDYPDLQEAKDQAVDLAAHCSVRAGVFDLDAKCIVFDSAL